MQKLLILKFIPGFLYKNSHRLGKKSLGISSDQIDDGKGISSLLRPTKLTPRSCHLLLVGITIVPPEMLFKTSGQFKGLSVPVKGHQLYLVSSFKSQINISDGNVGTHLGW